VSFRRAFRELLPTLGRHLGRPEEKAGASGMLVELVEELLHNCTTHFHAAATTASQGRRTTDERHQHCAYQSLEAISATYDVCVDLLCLIDTGPHTTGQR
jgi:hypothetical protein